jgi:hypothetical protein
MNFNDVIKYTGNFTINIKDRHNVSCKTIELQNQIMTLRLSEIINIFAGINPGLQIKYLALGTGSTAITGDETQLINEVYRTTVVTQDNTSDGVMYTSFEVLESDYVGQIEEVGIFCGFTASGTINTGTLLARMLWSHDKLATETISFRRRDTIV